MPAFVSITAATTVGPQTYNVGGRPVALVVWGNGQDSTALDDGFRFCHGLADADSQVCQSVAVADNAAAPGGCQVETNTDIYKMVATAASGTPATLQQAQLTAFTADGFTWNWSVVNGVASRIYVFAVFEDEVTNAKLVHIYCDDNPEVVTSVGFASSAIITLGGSTADLVGYAGAPFAALPLFGFSDGVSNYCADFWGRVSGSQTPVCNHHTNTSAVIRYISGIFEGSAAVGVAIGSVTPTGFSVTKGGFGAASLYHHFLCLGGITAQVGSVAQAAVDVPVSFGLTFTPSAILVASVGTITTTLGSAQPVVGGWIANPIATGYAHAALLNPGTTEAAGVNDETFALRMVTPAASGAASTVVASASINAAGTELTYDVSDGTARHLYFLALGLLSPASCSGGVVPQVDDPPGGVEFEGLGPHGDRIFIELDLD